MVHDGWEFRSERERGLCTQHVTNHSIAVHSMHTRKDFLLARAEFRDKCNAECERTIEPFEVDGLEDLCGRNSNIPKVYPKCAAVGHRKPAYARDAKGDGPTAINIEAMPRPDCRSVGETVPFIAARSEGGTIECT